MEKLIFINEGRDPLKEAVEGLVVSRPQVLETVENEYSHVCIKKTLPENCVRILVNGGGGRGPFFEGCAMEGLADAAVSGDFNCAPNAYMIYHTAKMMKCTRGILLVTNNFMGDYLNNDMAAELLELDHIPAKICYVSDDICSARGEEKAERGGLCGIGFILKIASAAAGAGCNLDEVYRLAQKANDRIRSLTFCYNKETKNVEFGNGFSGEAPVEIMSLRNVDEIVERALDVLLEELQTYKVGKVHVMVNRMLYMSYVEGYLILNAVQRILRKRGYDTGICTTGNYFDAFDRNGAILSLLVTDEELEAYTHPVHGFDFTI